MTAAPNPGVERALQRAALRRISDFADWAEPAAPEARFGEIPWLDVVTAASVALLAANTHLSAAEGVVDRLARLVAWLRGATADPPVADMTVAERLIVSLADDLAKGAHGVATAELARRALVPDSRAETELRRLATLNAVDEVNGLWWLRASR